MKKDVVHNHLLRSLGEHVKREDKMKIAVINGSPKGKYSITLQTIRYLERKFPEHEFNVLHAGQKIKAFEKDFTEAKKLLSDADAVIFAYPVYTFLAPSQLHRFVELIKVRERELSRATSAPIPIPCPRATALTESR